MKLKCTCCYKQTGNRHCSHCLLHKEKSSNVHDPVYINAGQIDINKISTTKKAIEQAIINLLKAKTGLKHFTAIIEIEIGGKVEEKYIKI